MRRDALSRTSAAGPPAAWREMSRMVWGVHFSANDRAHGLKRKAFQTGNALKGGGAWGVAVFSPSPQTIREAPQTHAAACGGSPRGLAKSPAREVEKKGTPAPAGHRNRGWHGAVRAPCYTATVNGMIVLRPRPTANGPGSTAIWRQTPAAGQGPLRRIERKRSSAWQALLSPFAPCRRAGQRVAAHDVSICFVRVPQGRAVIPGLLRNFRVCLERFAIEKRQNANKAAAQRRLAKTKRNDSIFAKRQFVWFGMHSLPN